MTSFIRLVFLRGYFIRTVFSNLNRFQSKMTADLFLIVLIISFFRIITTSAQIDVARMLENHGDVSENRKDRSVSGKDFLKLQGNWKYSKEEIEELFEKYYACIKKSNSRENRKQRAITAVLALEGQRVELPCSTCHRPDQSLQQAKLFWQRVRTSDASIKYIRSGKDGLKVSKDMTLVIDSVDVVDAGQYFCVKGEDAEAIYQVDVLFKEPQRTVSENDTATLLPAQRLKEHNIEVYTHWSDWGECNQCDKSGRRLKFGTCMVQKIDKDAVITPTDVPIMNLYPSGVPCRSTVLIRKVAHLKGIRDRKSEVITGFCFQSCPTTPPTIKVTDKNGKVVDIIGAAYHPIDRKPDLPPMVKRKVLYETEGKHLVLTCPTSNVGKVRWQRGDRVINTATITKQTKGRVSVDRLNRLHIRKLRKRDSAPYNCWVWTRHVSTIKVIVYEKMNDKIKHYISYGGLFITVVSIPLFCICKLCFGRSRRGRK